MCGIFGFAKREGWQSDTQMERINDVLTWLTYESVERGQDSTGISIISGDDSCTYKTLKASDELVCSEDWEEIVDTINPSTTVAMGHVRFATHGTISVRNAHPFQIGNVVGAHNGIIMNHSDVAKKINKDVEVDSEVIFGLINRKESIQEALDLIYGDYAISWVKDDPYTLNLLHEKGRPLAIAYWKKARCLFWASTSLILQEALRMAGLQIEAESLPVDRVYRFNTEKFWTGHNAEMEDVLTNNGGYWVKRKSYNHKKYGGYGYGTYGSIEQSCVYCYERTYRKDRICGGCLGYSELNSCELNLDSDGNWSAYCEDCKKKKIYDELVFDGKSYSCHECLLTDEKPYPEICDYCGDDVMESEIVEVDGYKVCTYCDEATRKYDTTGTALLPAHV